MILVVFQCSHLLWKNSCKYNVKQPGSMKWTQFMEITSSTLSFHQCGHGYFDEDKETLFGFYSSKLASEPPVRWVEISSSLISRSTFEANQGKKSLFSPTLSNSDSLGPTEAIQKCTLLLESLAKVTQFLKQKGLGNSETQSGKKHTQNMRKLIVACTKDLRHQVFCPLNSNNWSGMEKGQIQHAEFTSFSFVV